MATTVYGSKDELMEAIRATVRLLPKDASPAKSMHEGSLDDIDPELQGFAEDLLLQEHVLEKTATPIPATFFATPWSVYGNLLPDEHRVLQQDVVEHIPLEKILSQ